MDVVFTRGGHSESVHRIVWCLVDEAGTVLAESEPGASERPVFPRSALKPFQAMASVAEGALGRFGLEDRHLAIACASHGGGEEHLTAVREILAAAGLGEDDLACGPLAPRDPRVATVPARIVHNCSGKHALGMALCVLKRWPVEGYTQHGHPLQLAMCAETSTLTGTPAREIEQAADGCGMRTFQLPMAALARGFARVAHDVEAPARAMRAHPELVAYSGAVDTELMRAIPGVVAKIGAEGVLAAGTADGRGLALKVVDGAMRAIDPAAIALAREHLGLEVDLPELARPAVLNSCGEWVGRGMIG